MAADRKRDAREKFLLGGIVVKAGLANVDRAFLLGGLVELASIAQGSVEHSRLRDIGENAFRVAGNGTLQCRTPGGDEWQ